MYRNGNLLVYFKKCCCSWQIVIFSHLTLSLGRFFRTLYINLFVLENLWFLKHNRNFNSCVNVFVLHVLDTGIKFKWFPINCWFEFCKSIFFFCFKHYVKLHSIYIFILCEFFCNRIAYLIFAVNFGYALNDVCNGNRNETECEKNAHDRVVFCSGNLPNAGDLKQWDDNYLMTLPIISNKKN